MKLLIIALLVAPLLGGCALLAGAVVGGIVVSDWQQRQQWCNWHPYDCRYYLRHHVRK